jgi:ABC-type antimicrobial peptide transport system permease subunit
MDQQIARSPMALMPLRMGSLFAGAQGVIALLLAALGIFGLVSFAVTRRTREIGIRMAMGARTVDVVRLVTFQSLRLTFIGLACGLLLTFGLTRALAPLLYGVSPTDVTVFRGVVGVIVAATVLACWLPARRAAKVDPMVALRCE